MEKIFDPENIGMVFCPLCNGSGKLHGDHDGFNVCPKCGGCGLIIEEKKTIAFRSAHILLP